MNYFELFGIEQQFDVELDAITLQYRELQKQFHPDKFATAADSEKLAVVQKSAQINDAYTTLKDPVSRAEYLLKLRGLDIQHETQTLQDPMFLMQQMEYRETLEDLSNSDDMYDAIMEFEEQVNAEIDSFKQQLAVCLQQFDNEAAANLIRKLKFMFKLLHELERLEDEQVEF